MKKEKNSGQNNCAQEELKLEQDTDPTTGQNDQACQKENQNRELCPECGSAGVQVVNATCRCCWQCGWSAGCLE